MRTLCALLLAQPISFNSRPLCLSAPPSRVMLAARQGPDPSWGGGARKDALILGGQQPSAGPIRGGGEGEMRGGTAFRVPISTAEATRGLRGAGGIPLAGGGAEGEGGREGGAGREGAGCGRFPRAARGPCGRRRRERALCGRLRAAPGAARSLGAGSGPS